MSAVGGSMILMSLYQPQTSCSNEW